jgi:hypothetical protein
MHSFSNTLQWGCCVWNLNQIAALQGTSVGGISCAGRALGGLAGFSVASSFNCPLIVLLILLGYLQRLRYWVSLSCPLLTSHDDMIHNQRFCAFSIHLDLS